MTYCGVIYDETYGVIYEAIIGWSLSETNNH